MKTTLFILCFITTNLSFSEETEETAITQKYSLKVDAKNYNSSLLQIAYYFGDKTYLKPDDFKETDSIYRSPNGLFEWEFKEPMDGGMYVLVFKPDNKTFQFIVPNNQQKDFKIIFDYKNIYQTFEVIGDEGENKLFLDYTLFLEQKRSELKGVDEANKESLMEKLNTDVEAYQNKLLTEHPNTLTAKIVKSQMPIETPIFNGTKENNELKAWQYQKKHWFDNYDLTDPAMLRTPVLFSRIDHYIEKLTVQHPDSISNSIDVVLKKLEPAKESFKYYVVHFLNKYAGSKFVGFDAVYVHIADNYYKNGKANWVEKEQLEKILKNANAIRPILIGKKAPNIRLQADNGIAFNLHDIKSNYVVLYFWSKTTKDLEIDIENIKVVSKDLSDMDAEMILVCTDSEAQVDLSLIERFQIQGLLNTQVASLNDVDYKNYNIKSTPQLFVLDQDKIIKSKRIGTDQVLEVLKSLEQK